MSTEKKYEFKAEIKKLLDILSKSLYKHKEIFLRELVSNSTDAMKKLHFISLKDKNINDPDAELKIEIIGNAKENTLIIRDAGIGMTKQDLIDNLGTIAGSGSQKFVENLSQEENEDKELDLDIIGQFGVGFYSVFMVADLVQVVTKSYVKDSPALMWESDGSGEFEITEIQKDVRGTDIIIHLKEEEKDYLTQVQIEGIIKKYSNFVPYPIFVTEIKDEKEKIEVDMDEEDEEGKKEGAEEPREPEAPKPVNDVDPLWKRNPSDISEEDYKNFYHYVSHRYDDYAHVINYKIDGGVQFRSISFIPGSSNQELMRPESEFGLDLYSKNVLIVKNSEDMIPKWLRFVKGMVDSDDIPLNISRETIQANRVIMKMSTLIVKRIIRDITDIAEKDPEKYATIWKNFGYFFKEGIVTDQTQKEKLAKLLRFPTSKTEGDKMIGLDEYVKNLAPNQTEIFYLIGENLSTLKLSPHLGFYKKEGLEVVFFNEPIDNYLMMNIQNYKTTNGEGDDAIEVTYSFTPIDVAEKSEAKKDAEEKDGEEKSEEEKSDVPETTQKFLDNVKTILGDKIVDAKVSDRLYGNACRLANPSGGMTSSMQRAMRYWTQNAGDKSFQIPKKILEFNPEHPMVVKMIDIVQSDAENGRIDPVVQQMFENCLLSEGDLPDPSMMVPRINQLLEMLITGNDKVKNVAEEAKPVEEAKPAEEEKTE